jgi:fibronectin type 3 domain-containing protein
VSQIGLPLTLNPGQATSITLTFDPTSAGSMTGQLTISSNSSTNPTLTIPLSGTATSPSYQVNLTWQAPTTSVAGYHVYRAPSGTTSYALLNSAVDTQTIYTDPNVQSGSSYDYVVKSVDTSGTESTPSNITTVNIP